MPTTKGSVDSRSPDTKVCKLPDVMHLIPQTDTGGVPVVGNLYTSISLDQALMLVTSKCLLVDRLVSGIACTIRFPVVTWKLIMPVLEGAKVPGSQ